MTAVIHCAWPFIIRRTGLAKLMIKIQPTRCDIIRDKLFYKNGNSECCHTGALICYVVLYNELTTVNCCIQNAVPRFENPNVKPAFPEYCVLLNLCFMCLTVPYKLPLTINLMIETQTHRSPNNSTQSTRHGNVQYVKLGLHGNW